MRGLGGGNPDRVDQPAPLSAGETRLAHGSLPPVTNWIKIFDDDCRVPPGRELNELTAELAQCLRDPDPNIRDGHPYVVLRTWIERDVIAGDRREQLGDEMADRFTDPRTEARTFAPLVLDMIVSRGDFRPRWLDAFSRWYPAETDLRGYHPRLGWLHAVAHGADLLGTFGRHRDVDPAAMLDLAGARLLARTDHLWAEREDDRLARAVALALTRPELTAAASTRWLDPITADFRAVSASTTPTYVSNALRTLRALYVFVDCGIPVRPDGPRQQITHRQEVKQRLVDVLEGDAKAIG
ncbi:DUF2785 domain-containing protein [Micromonospora sp. NPDC052213]|uniref:DUF2785 domain-containing protein n=1 Tax=Micromonospora sp. NPDC052213 TaxID=3155812 RepID=UPI00342CB763